MEIDGPEMAWGGFSSLSLSAAIITFLGFQWSAIKSFRFSKFPRDKDARIGVSFLTASMASAIEAAVSGPLVYSSNQFLSFCLYTFFNLKIWSPLFNIALFHWK